MSILKLEFSIPEERIEANRAIHGSDSYAVLWDLDQWLRTKIKHGLGPDDAKTAPEAFEECRNFLNSECNDRNVNISGDY